MFQKTLIGVVAAGALVGLISACGSSSDSEGGENAPPRRSTDATGDTFALESGNYVISEIYDVSDGCAIEPNNSSDPITAVVFNLSNLGKGRIQVDRCEYNGTSTIGDVLDNRGVLRVAHQGRRDQSGNLVAVYDQDCRMDITVTANNQFEGLFTERQSNRNSDLRESGVDVDTCTTSYKFTMRKR